MEAKVATGLEKEQKGERFTLIEPPRLPIKPFKPNRLAIMAIGSCWGSALGSGLPPCASSATMPCTAPISWNPSFGFRFWQGYPRL